MKLNIDERPDLVTADAMHRGPHFKKIVHKGLVEAELLAGIQYRTKSAEGKVRHPFFKGNTAITIGITFVTAVGVYLAIRFLQSVL